MSYFPAFLKLDHKKILLIGGGVIAYEKLKHLLEFGSNISVIASALSPQMHAVLEEKKLHFKVRKYERGDIEKFDIVVVAIDNIALQEEIFQESRGYNCLCNCVDSVEYCDFIFSAYIKKDDLIVAVSTSGSSPAFAKQFKNYLLELIPPDIGVFLSQMAYLRKTLPKGKERMKMLEQKVQEYIKSWRK